MYTCMCTTSLFILHCKLCNYIYKSSKVHKVRDIGAIINIKLKMNILRGGNLGHSMRQPKQELTHKRRKYHILSNPLQMSEHHQQTDDRITITPAPMCLCTLNIFHIFILHLMWTIGAHK